MEYEQEVPADIAEQFEQGLCRLIKGEPLGHVLGFEWFYGYRFKVNEWRIDSQIRKQKNWWQMY